MDQPIQRLRLNCNSELCDSSDLNALVKTALQRRVEHFDLSSCQDLPLAVFRCKALVVLKFTNLTLTNISSVDLASL